VPINDLKYQWQASTNSSCGLLWIVAEPMQQLGEAPLRRISASKCLPPANRFEILTLRGFGDERRLSPGAVIAPEAVTRGRGSSFLRCSGYSAMPEGAKIYAGYNGHEIITRRGRTCPSRDNAWWLRGSLARRWRNLRRRGARSRFRKCSEGASACWGFPPRRHRRRFRAGRR
jgi:hypothetical protein